MEKGESLQCRGVSTLDAPFEQFKPERPYLAYRPIGSWGFFQEAPGEDKDRSTHTHSR